jgi:hypothetical protein
MGTLRVQMKVVLPLFVHWACRAETTFFYLALLAPVGPEQNIFFLAVHYFSSYVPIAQQAQQAVVTGRLSLSMWLSLAL